MTTMRRVGRGVGALALGITVLTAAPASAQTAAPGDAPAALGDCMTLKSTGEDRIQLARWFLTGLGSSPQMRSVVTITPQAKEAQDRAIAALFTRLLADACVNEARAVAAANGQAGFRSAGETFGRIAMRELLTNPEVDASMGAFTKYINQADFAKLAPPTAQPAPAASKPAAAKP